MPHNKGFNLYVELSHDGPDSNFMHAQCVQPEVSKVVTLNKLADTGHPFVQKHKVVQVFTPAMADLIELLGICNVCQIVTDEDIRSLEDIRQRLGIFSVRESTMNSKQVGNAWGWGSTYGL
jgi:hypothetical protein